MFKLYVLIILGALFLNVQCRPSDTSVNSTATGESHLFMGNISSSDKNNQLGSFASQIGNVEKEIDANLLEDTPYLNFMFDPDGDSDDDDECVDQMIILLVPQDSKAKDEKKSAEKSPVVKFASNEDNPEYKNRFLYVPSSDSDGSDSSSSSSSSSEETNSSKEDSEEDDDDF